MAEVLTMMRVVERKKFWFGLIGLVTFFIVLGFWVSPVIDHKTGLEWADDLFNQLAKNSAYFIPSAERMAAKFTGKAVDLGINPRWPGVGAGLEKIVKANGMSARVVGDGRVRIVADLGHLGKAALVDAELLFKGREQELRNKYRMSGKEVIYYWWAAFDGLTRRYIQENRSSEANFTKFMTSRVLEPAYNFAGIESRNISENVGAVVFLLGFYVLYTLWYGFSIMYLFEGLGIKAEKPREKREV